MTDCRFTHRSGNEAHLAGYWDTIKSRFNSVLVDNTIVIL